MLTNPCFKSIERHSTDSGTAQRDCKAQIVELHSLGGTAKMSIAQIIKILGKFTVLDKPKTYTDLAHVHNTWQSIYFNKPRWK